MDPRWGLFVLVAVCLLQLPAVIVLARRLELAEELPWRGGYADGRRRGRPAPDESPSQPSAVCPDCGAANDRGYAYCRRCVAPL